VTNTKEPLYYPTQKLLIGADADGQRIDNYLMSQLKGVPRSHIYRILRKGEVRVNGGRKKPVYKLEKDDLVRVPPIKIDHVEQVNVPERVYQELLAGVLFENDLLMVINKPSGMAVHSGTGVSFGVIEAMKQHHKASEKLELVHRIDRDTSGCLLLAKDRKTLNALQNSFRSRDMQKSYLALIKGKLPAKSIVVTKPLEKREISGENMVVVSPEGKSAHSEFILQQRFMGASFVKVVIKTGRTHQIRVHAKSLGQPLAGDSKYGDSEFNRHCKKYGGNRLFLHAAELAFELGDESFQFKAPLPDELQAVLDKLP
jgi:23S rRNA pseudouridine955/2504/2580 synthase